MRNKDLDWRGIEESLDQRGFATVERFLTARECQSARALWSNPLAFRKSVNMSRQRLGEGEYRYFDSPEPEIVANLRLALYPPLAELANAWAIRLRDNHRFPPKLQSLERLCRSEGQTSPASLMLRYETEGFNRLHQDIYGPVHFPFQVACLLSRPGVDFGGGEFVLTEQRARMQNRPSVAPLSLGDAVVFASGRRPVKTRQGYSRATVRHGVSAITHGCRITLGAIFHHGT